MHKSELKIHLTLINRVIKEYELKVRTIETHRSTSSLKIKFWNWLEISLQRVNCTPIPYVYYNEKPSAQIRNLLSTTCILPMNWYPQYNKVVLLPNKITSQILELQITLLCDRLTYSSSKEHMSNSTKGIIVVTYFMITYPLDHPREHTISIPWDIMVPILRIHVATNLHQ